MGTIDIRKPKLITLLTFFAGRSYFSDAPLLSISYSHSHDSVVNILAEKPFSATLQVFQTGHSNVSGEEHLYSILKYKYPNFKYFIILTRTFTSSVVMYKIS